MGGSSASKPKQPVKEERNDDEKLPLLGQWEFEAAVDEKDVELKEIDYPPPEPSLYLDTSEIDFTEVDDHALNTKINLANSFTDLTNHLTSKYEDDLKKVRSLIVWLSGQRIRTRTYNEPIDIDTPLEYMDLIKQKRGTFAAFFALLCRAADVPCVIVKGFCKTSHAKMYDIDLASWKCTWNAVFIHDQWRIIHPYWICTPFAEKSSLNGYVLETGGKLLEGNSDQKRIFNSAYFLPDPEKFVRLCFAEDRRWQLYKGELPRTDFASSPYLTPSCFDFEVQLLNNQKSIIQTNDGFGIVEFQIKRWKNFKSFDVGYKLHHIKDKPNNPKFKLIDGAYVLFVRTDDVWTFQVRCPSVGIFQISFYASKNSEVSKWLFDIQIQCLGHTGDATPLPFSPKDLGWGPNHLTEKHGLLLPSHESGIILVKEKEEVTIKFILIHKLDYQVELVNENVSQWDLKRSVTSRIEKRELNITVKIPEDGEYILKLKVPKPKTKMYHSICVYLLTNNDPRHNGNKIREMLPLRKAREKLRYAVIGFDVEELEDAIHRCIKEKAPSNDPEVTKAKQRLIYIQIKKDLRDAVMRRRIDKLDKAIQKAKQSPFRRALYPNIRYSDGLRQQLIKIRDFGCSVMDLKQNMISELHTYSHPPTEVYESLKATYIILGEKEDMVEVSFCSEKDSQQYLSVIKKIELSNGAVYQVFQVYCNIKHKSYGHSELKPIYASMFFFQQNWVYIQSLLRKHGSESILSRIGAFSGVVDVEALEKAKACLQKIPENKVATGILIGAHTFLSWTQSIIKELETKMYHPKYVDHDDALETRRSLDGDTEFDELESTDVKERLQTIEENGIDDVDDTKPNKNGQIIPRIVIN
ncbi:hypothetical protein KUTeg_017818 [Tegillarca granosa]|uniref:Transglutaminase-like domain-containing protein n=1 Tax=Tegillarca granosa TaxID=220873 RepID=A0ABQ9EGA0_TEGGR|nr:hypothetical protein KUTeg_017818 [Tegillarca granosa]